MNLKSYFFLFVALLFFCKNTSDVTKSVTNQNIVSGIPEIPDSLSRELAKFQNIRSASFQGWLSDGSGIIMLTRFAEMDQVHIVRSAAGARHQITFQNESVIWADACPDPQKKEIFFMKDSGGNEKFQLYSVNYESKLVTMLTDGVSQNSGVCWSNKGDRFVYQSTKRNGRDWDIYLGSIDNANDAERILTVEGTWSSLDWSPDDKQILLCRYISRTASFLYIYDLDSRMLTPLHDTLDTVSQECGLWDSQGKGIFLTSDEKTDFRTLRYYNLETKRDSVLTRNIQWDVRSISMSVDRNQLAFTTNEHGFSSIYLMDTKSFRFKKVDYLPYAVIGNPQFSPDGKRLGMTLHKPNRTEDVYVIDLQSESVDQWTFSEMGELDSTSFIVPQIIQYPSFDSANGNPRLIPCFTYKPSGTGPFPVLIFIHGGPESQFWPYFSSSIQYFLTKLGIAVVAPNVRGSGGYGKNYLSLDNGFNREYSVRDIGALLDWISIQKEFDTSRIAVMGGSYGGYMALASMVHYQNRIKAGIDLYGISNFITFLENTGAYRRDLRRVEYGDERDSLMRKFLYDISPVNHADKIKCPLLIIQGANDPRVPSSESEQIVKAVRKNGGTVWFLLYGNEGHGFRRKTNRDYQESVIALFLSNYIGQ